MNRNSKFGDDLFRPLCLYNILKTTPFTHAPITWYPQDYNL